MRTPAGLLLVAALVLPALAPAPASASSHDAGLTAAPWLHPACVDPATTGGLPTGACRSMRILLEVEVPQELQAARDLPVTAAVDVARALGEAGFPTDGGQLLGFELDLRSLILLEVGGDLRPLRRDAGNELVPEPLLSFPGDLASTKAFDAKSNPTVTLQWVLSGVAGASRHYLLYLDSLHHQGKTPVEAPASELGRVATAVGPGRGSVAYVPLHGNIGLNTPQDPRTLRVTNLQGTAVQLSVYQYDRFGVPDLQPSVTQTLNPGVGTTVTIPYNIQYAQGALKVVATGGLVQVEAASRVTSATFQPSSARLFLPSADGGYVGTLFAGSSPSATRWDVYCPKVDANGQPCQVAFTGTPSTATIQPGEYASLAARRNLADVLTATTGVVLVERVPTGNPPNVLLGLTPWPPADGPVSSSLFYGEALSDVSRDRLVLDTRSGGSQLAVADLVGQRAPLADRLEPGGPGLFTDSAGAGWGTSWARGWTLRSNPQAQPDHEDGPARIEDKARKGLAVLNGVVGDDAKFSALAPLQSRDGGLHYEASIPADAQGLPLGNLVLFSPFAGTTVTATRVSSSGIEEQFTRQALQRDEHVMAFIAKPGHWEVSADRPILLAWLKVGTDPFSGFAPALTQGASVETVAAQFAGYAFGFGPDTVRFQAVRPGNPAAFQISLENLARKVDGQPKEQTISLQARVPSGWPAAELDPSTVETGIDGLAQDATVSVQVPATVDLSQGGATVELVARSGQDSFTVVLPLRVNFLVERGVDVSADGHESVAERRVAAGQNATYLVRVENSGAVADAFNLEYLPPNSNWIVNVTCPGPGPANCFRDGLAQTPVMPVGKSLEYSVSVRSLFGSGTGRLVTPVLATSTSNPSVADSVRLSTVIDVGHDFTVLFDEPTRVVAPGAQATFRIQLRNDGVQDEEVRIRLNGTRPDGWPPTEAAVEGPTGALIPLAAVNHTVGVPLQSSRFLVLRQRVPATAAPNLLQVVRMGVEGRLGSGSSEHELQVVSGQSLGVNAELPEGPLDLLPGSTLAVPLTLRSGSNGVQQLAVRAGALPLPQEWNVTLGGQPGPWSLNLSAEESRTLLLNVSASRHAPASSLASPRLVVHLSVPGSPTLPFEVGLRVPEVRALSILSSSVRLEAGRSQDLAVRLRNDGNVPLLVAGSLQGVDWPVQWRNLTVEPGREGRLAGMVVAPGEAGDRTATLRAVEASSGALLASRDLQVTVEAPRLAVTVQEARSLGPGVRAYTVEVANRAPTPARSVQVQLLSERRVLDAVTLETILPGAVQFANLVGPEGDGLVLHVVSADDPAGIDIPVTLPAAASAKGTPADAVPLGAALAPLAAALLARRRRA